MEIKTKFNLGDTVYYIENNKSFFATQEELLENLMLPF